MMVMEQLTVMIQNVNVLNTMSKNKDNIFYMDGVKII